MDAFERGVPTDHHRRLSGKQEERTSAILHDAFASNLSVCQLLKLNYSKAAGAKMYQKGVVVVALK